jgi:predicted outer membrane repeat protein
MRTSRIPLVAGAVFLIAAGPATPRTWYVKPDSTGDVPTIAVAVDSAAAEGDTVLLADGTFTGPGNKEVDCLDKALTITSESGDPETCIINCGGVSDPFVELAAFYFNPSENGIQRLEGVTITRGCGGVICNSGSSPEILNCILRDNWCMACEIGYPGAAMRCLPGSHATITDCVFRENDAMAGGGVYCDDASLTFTNTSFIENYGSEGGAILGEGSLALVSCLFERNFGGGAPMGERLGGGLSWEGSVDATDCVFRDNICNMGPGGAIHYTGVSQSDLLTLAGCVFEGNCSDDEGAAVAVISYWSEVNAAVSISRCTFVGNGLCVDSFGGSTLCLATAGDITIENTLVAYGTAGGALCPTTITPVLTCCDIYGNEGGDWTGTIESQLGVNGNISADPLFCDAQGGDYRLETCSPCLPGNHPDGYDCGVPIGAYCSGCPCKTSTLPSTWGAIKAMYR